MTPQHRRRLIPFVVFAVATSVLLVVIFGSKRASDKKAALLESQTTKVVEPTEPENTPTKPTTPETSVVQKETPPEETSTDSGTNTKDLTEVAPFEVLSVLSHDVPSDQIVLGALNAIDTWQMEVRFTQVGAGIASIQFSNIFETVDGKLAWREYRKNGGTPPPIDDLYLLTTEQNVHQQT